ncbi:conserved hypothetical protein [Ricinus communis]|uniref:Uncharacterized protein n=1 Tax=Ricinus communis TaxID=3988 RepID=B9T4X1_RICCO|nr:conserved hypothetical protein [Ricinus communis]
MSLSCSDGRRVLPQSLINNFTVAERSRLRENISFNGSANASSGINSSDTAKDSTALGICWNSNNAQLVEGAFIEDN